MIISIYYIIEIIILMNEINKRISVCPKCLGIPFLKIIIHHPEQIEIDCQCGYNEILKIEDYLNTLYKLNINDLDEKYKYPKCAQHNSIYDCFCLYCEEYICKFCRKISEHKYHFMRKVEKTLHSERIIKDINEAYNFLKIHIPLFTEKMMKKFPDFSQPIKNQSNYYLSINTNILHLIQILVNTYNLDQQNELIATNLNQNCHISCRPYDNYQRLTFDLVMIYFMENCILQPPYKMECKIENAIIQKYYDYERSHSLGFHRLKDYTLIQVQDNQIIIKSFGEQTIINCSNGIINTFDILEDEKIVTGEYNNKINIYKRKESTYILEHTIDNVSADSLIALPGNRFAFCGCEDSMINIMSSIEPYNLLYSIVYKKANKSYLYLLSNKLYFLSGSAKDDSEVKMWDVNTYQCECSFSPVSWFAEKSIFELPDNRLIIGGNKMITIINYQQKQIELQIIKNYIQGINAFMEIRDGTIIMNQKDTRTLIQYNDRKKEFRQVAYKHHHRASFFYVIDSCTFLSGDWKHELVYY